MPNEPSDPSVTQQLKHDAICLHFEQAWRRGERPRIESHLKGLTDRDRSQLLPQILLLELEYLQQLDAPAPIDAYLARFPNEAEQVRAAFADHAAALGRGADGSAAGRSGSEFPENTVDLKPVSERPGSEIGRYKLLEQIGEGGMGVVYMAQQQRPVQRKVALKIIKPGMDTKQVVARFEAERQALAMMDHPNIARVLDAGSTDSGRPYFVMELVRGVPITDFCDRNKMATRERLQLFMLVCQAVQHAHTKGVIHRDLKPTNVLVTLHDGVPVPKIIDFGVAKATGQQLTERTMFTAFAQMVGTPLYMSPEQAEMSGLDVDTRSDIYSLGVLLYELLTGVTPFDRKRLHTAAFDEIRRIILEEEPVKPSTRVSTTDQSSVAVSAHRSTDPIKLKQLLRGELDWIVMKALEKDRNRRYETANGLRAEINRYLNGDPVEACPPTASYRLRKFARRYRSHVAVVAGFMAVLLASTVVAWGLFVRARAAKNDAMLATAEALEAQQRAEDAKSEIQSQKNRAEQNLRFAREQEVRAANLAEQLQSRLYDYTLIKAATALDQNEYFKASQLLSQSLPEQRGWEWHRLNRIVGAAGELELAGPPIRGFEASPVDPRCFVLDEADNLRMCALSDGSTLWSRPCDIAGIPIIDVSPRGDLIVVRTVPGFGPGQLEVRDSEGQRLWSMGLDADNKSMGWASFSADDRYLALSTVDMSTGQGHVQLHRADDPDPIWQKPCTGLAVVGFDLDAKHLFLTLAPQGPEGESTLRCWKVEDASEVWSVQRNHASLMCMSPDGMLLTGGLTHSLEVRDPKTGEVVQELTCNLSAPALDVRISPDGRHVYSCSAIGDLAVWDWQTRSELFTLPEAFASIILNYTRPAFTYDGKHMLFVRAGSSTANLVPLARAPTELALAGHEEAVKGAIFSRDGQFVHSFAIDRTLRKWSTSTGQEMQTIAADEYLQLMEVSHGDLELVFDVRAGMELWRTKEELFVRRWPHSCDPCLTAVSPDGRYLASCAAAERLQVIDTSTGEAVLSNDADRIATVEFSGDSRRVFALFFYTGQLEEWDLANGNARRTIRSADGTLLPFADALVRIPNPEAGDSDHEQQPALASNRMAFPIGPTIEVWNVDVAQRERTLRGHKEAVFCLAVSKDGSRLFSGDASGAVYVWNLETGEQLLTFQAHEPRDAGPWRMQGVTSLALSPDGMTLATTGNDGLVKLWETTHPSGELLQQRRIVAEATGVVNEHYRRSTRLRDVLASLKTDSAISDRVLPTALEIANARGDRPNSPFTPSRQESDERELVLNVRLKLIEARNNLGQAIAAMAGFDLDAAGDDWRQQTTPGQWRNIVMDVLSFPITQEELNALLTMLVNDHPGVHQFLYARGSLHARAARWQEADADFSRAMELLPENSAMWHEYAFRLAYLLAFTEQWDRYRDVCRQTMGNFADTDDLQLAERTAKMCLFSHDIAVDIEQAARLADKAFDALDDATDTLKPWYAQAKGIADYRRDDFVSAIEALERYDAPSAPLSVGRAITRLYLAMAYEQTGQHEKARASLRSLNSWLEAVEEELTAPTDNSWNDFMHVHIVLPEAETLIADQ